MAEDNPQGESTVEFDVDFAVSNAAKSIRAHAREVLESDFPTRPSMVPIRYWPYHSVNHSLKVGKGLHQLGSIVNDAFPELYSIRKLQLGEVAAMLHDVKQEFALKNINGALKRVRATGVSESFSGVEAMNLMRGYEDIFGIYDVAEVNQAIISTTVVFDPKLKSAVHPFLGPHSSINDVLLALADVNVAGLRPLAELQASSYSLFREDNIDFLHWWLTSDWPKDTEPLRQRMIDWMQIQVDFTTGRRDRLQTDLGYLPREVGELLLGSFNQFDASIKAAETWLRGAQNMNFNELRESFGYT